MCSISEISIQQLVITRSESHNYYDSNHTPDKAHDGNYDTFYCFKDGALAGNFLKLYLSNVHSIGEVKIVSRKYDHYDYRPRMLNTEAKVYSTVDGETEVGSCGIITGTSDYIYYFMVKL